MKCTSCSLLIWLSICSAITIAQPRPTLTTEDVIKWRTANPQRADHFIVPKQESSPSAQSSPEQQDARFLAAEKDWNARLQQAKVRVRDFERRASESELAASQSRNAVFHNDANTLNANNARVVELQQLARTYRNEAQLAQATLNRLLDEGRDYGFQLTYIAPRLKNGEPNLDYYRTQFLELQAELQAEQIRVEALQLRTNRVQTSINSNLNSTAYFPARRRGFLFYPNNGAADGFYLNRLRNELADTGSDLNASRSRVAVLLELLNQLQEEGRRAGVPPGTFR
ncbi:MAG: hypothetical protein JNM09_23265 [Blastocatellia bacterium]|nr:hypothetical protein [Blastocatellia bacterium]